MGLGTDMFSYLKDADVPYSRLHDVGSWHGGNMFVDIPNLFRDFDADENDPKSYDFTFTDVLLKALVDYGVEPYYRLGRQIRVQGAPKDIPVLAATDGKFLKVFFANIGKSACVDFSVPGWRLLTSQLTDVHHQNTVVANLHTLPSDSFGVLTFIRD